MSFITVITERLALDLNQGKTKDQSFGMKRGNDRRLECH